MPQRTQRHMGGHRFPSNATRVWATHIVISIFLLPPSRDGGVKIQTRWSLSGRVKGYFLEGGGPVPQRHVGNADMKSSLPVAGCPWTVERRTGNDKSALNPNGTYTDKNTARS